MDRKPEGVEIGSFEAIGVVASGAEAAGGSWTVTAGSGKSGTPADLVFFTLLVSFAWALKEQQRLV